MEQTEGLERARAVILVEGDSDRVALETLALRRGLDLGAERTVVVPLRGATNIGRFVERLGPRGLGLRLSGLCDAAERGYFLRALERAGLGSDLEARGFHVCEADLEDELVRALGVPGVEAVVESLGDLRAFRTFQNQPAQRGRPVDRQLRRFIGTLSGRKSRYARALVQALDPAAVPRPLSGVLSLS
ncbi:TOPRIM nucleotidyl transferase/hydrolase domain-containing protein [Nocardiopsis synnemataformans]|uniref:TOPRIM nucleotidyl transferase/hydrolase domain-containing protein n=1 Tax=Nocardiopsis synnemataformans TaxID=61305 RepID=UPI003EC0B9D6